MSEWRYHRGDSIIGMKNTGVACSSGVEEKSYASLVSAVSVGHFQK